MMKQRPNVVRPLASGFTLVELLTVVAIVTILMAVLIPALSRSRELAKRNACASNLKQILTGVILYTSHNEDQTPNRIMTSNGVYPTDLTNLGTITGWMTTGITPQRQVLQILSESIDAGYQNYRTGTLNTANFQAKVPQTPKFYTCPSVSFMKFSGFTNADDPWQKTSYMFNEVCLNLKMSYMQNVANSAGVIILSERNMYDNIAYDRPMDTSSPSIGGGPITGAGGVTQFRYWNTNLPPLGPGQGHQIHDLNSNPSVSNTGLSNYGYLDGHVESFRTPDIYARDFGLTNGTTSSPANNGTPGDNYAAASSKIYGSIFGK